MDERRSKPRLSVNLDAVWNKERDRQSARVTDLSEGGCYLDTVGEVMAGEIVAFRIMFPDGDWLYLEGEVRHHRHGLGFGVRFVDLNEDQLEKLRLLLSMAKDVDPGAPISADLVEDYCLTSPKRLFLNQVLYRMYSVWSVEESVLYKYFPSQNRLTS